MKDLVNLVGVVEKAAGESPSESVKCAELIASLRTAIALESIAISAEAIANSLEILEKITEPEES